MGLFVGSLLSAAPYFYIYTYDTVKSWCTDRQNTMLIMVYVWSTEMMFNLVAPLSTLTFNVLVIRGLVKAHRARRRRELGRTAGVTADNSESSSKTSTTLMLLTVSFFYVVTTLPMTLVYMVHDVFQTGDKFMTDQEVSQSLIHPENMVTGHCLVLLRPQPTRRTSWELWELVGNPGCELVGFWVAAFTHREANRDNILPCMVYTRGRTVGTGVCLF